MIGWLLNNELEKIWKEAVVTGSRYRPEICMKELRKTTKTLVWIASVLAEIWSKHLPDTSLDQPGLSALWVLTEMSWGLLLGETGPDDSIPRPYQIVSCNHHLVLCDECDKALLNKRSSCLVVEISLVPWRSLNLHRGPWRLIAPKVLLWPRAARSTTMDSYWWRAAVMALSGYLTYVVAIVLTRGQPTKVKPLPFSWLQTSQHATPWDLMERQVASQFVDRYSTGSSKKKW
jgi:hypothetical protein